MQACREFEAVAPGRNVFARIGNRPARNLGNNAPIRTISLKQARVLLAANNCTALILHSLNGEAIRLLNSLKKPPVVVWLGWGFDYYSQLLSSCFQKSLIRPGTARLMQEQPTSKNDSRWLSALKKRVFLPLAEHPRGLGHMPVLNSLLTRRTLQQVHFFSPVLDVEYDMAVNANSWFTPRYVAWNYGTFEDDFAEGLEGSATGDNIMVGNSATPENNHIDLFYSIKHHIDTGSRKIIVPLSYGDDWYKWRVIAEGYYLFGDAFTPLTDYLDRKSYHDILKTCGHAFMGHERQQALGNILTLLILGASVYMSQNSPLQKWLKDKGARITALDFDPHRQDQGHQSELLTTLTDAEKTGNIEVVKGHWGREVQRSRTKALIESIHQASA